MTSSCTSSTSSKFFPARYFFRWTNKWKSLDYHKQQQFVCEFPLDVHLLRWEIVRRNARRIWRDFGSALSFQTRLTQTKPVLPLSNEHDSQVKDQGRRQCFHNKHKHFPIGLHVIYLYFPDTPHIWQMNNCTPLKIGIFTVDFLIQKLLVKHSNFSNDKFSEENISIIFIKRARVAHSVQWLDCELNNRRILGSCLVKDNICSCISTPSYAFMFWGKGKIVCLELISQNNLN